MAASIDGRIYKQMVASINSVIIIILILFLIIIVVVFVLIVISLLGNQVTSCPCHCRHQCHYLYLYHLGSRAT